MFGLQQTMDITLVAVQPVSLHGSQYFDLTYQVDGEAETRHFRVNPEAFYPHPQPGDRVRVNWLMGNIMGATRLTATSPPGST